MSGDSIQRVVQPAVTEDGKKAPGLKFSQPRVVALMLALTLFQPLIDGFRKHDLRQQVADLLGVMLADYTPHQMTYDLRRLRPRVVSLLLPVEPPFGSSGVHFPTLDDAGQHRVCATLHLSSSPAKLDCPMPRLTLLGAAKDVPEAARMFPGKPAFLAT